jgi:hypothetical protein
MKHQLIPNSYTVCESTEQCKELFEWAKNNGIDTYMQRTNADIVISCNGNMEIVSFMDDTDIDVEFWSTFNLVPLPEFIARLKGNFIKPTNP